MHTEWKLARSSNGDKFRHNDAGCPKKGTVRQKRIPKGTNQEMEDNNGTLDGKKEEEELRQELTTELRKAQRTGQEKNFELMEFFSWS